MVDVDLSGDELRRLARVDALLRTAAVRRRDGCGRTPTGRRKYELELSFAELLLIYKSLESAKTLRVVPPQDELLDDVMQLVSQALKAA